MNFRLQRLTLQFGRTKEIIELGSHVTFFHGGISAGKSSIVKLIDACLGGSIPETTAIKQEFVSAQLSANLGGYDVLFERSTGSNQVQVSWIDSEQQGASVMAPIDNSPVPIWGDNVYGLSDLIFYLAGVGPMRVRKNKTDPDAPLIPLSFRDVMWYCYLDQDELDSTFFHLEGDDPRSPKSRDVMRFVLGYYTERLNELEQQLAREVDAAKSKAQAAEQLRKFFSELGYESGLEIQSHIENAQTERRRLSEQLLTLRENQQAETHFADDLRASLRNLGEELNSQDAALSELEKRLTEERSLRAEILSTKFKLSRLNTASSILSGMKFDSCPQCGTQVGDRDEMPNQCTLCTSNLEVQNSHVAQREDLAQKDLDARLVDIEDSIKRKERARQKQQSSLNSLRALKDTQDRRLSEELRSYDSAFLSQSRNIERSIAALDQSLLDLEKDARIPVALERYAREVDAHQVEASRLRREITDEKRKLADRETGVEKLEQYFFEALYTVRFPKLTRQDRIQINRRNWMPYILPKGDESLAYNFFGAGSGGKKTLFNVCYGVALHRVAEELGLPLPTFLIIDSPMKNIGTEVNRNIFMAFYEYLYGLAAGPLKQTQFVIVDTELSTPSAAIDFSERLMSPDDPEHPPLIPYYSGH
jgi:hypothetical protein